MYRCKYKFYESCFFIAQLFVWRLESIHLLRSESFLIKITQPFKILNAQLFHRLVLKRKRAKGGKNWKRKNFKGKKLNVLRPKWKEAAGEIIEGIEETKAKHKNRVYCKNLNYLFFFLSLLLFQPCWLSICTNKIHDILSLIHKEFHFK